MQHLTTCISSSSRLPSLAPSLCIPASSCYAFASSHLTTVSLFCKLLLALCQHPFSVGSPKVQLSAACSFPSFFLCNFHFNTHYQLHTEDTQLSLAFTTPVAPHPSSWPQPCSEAQTMTSSQRSSSKRLKGRSVSKRKRQSLKTQFPIISLFGSSGTDRAIKGITGGASPEKTLLTLQFNIAVRESAWSRN